MQRRDSVVREVRRAQIVGAARAIVAERGLEGLTFAALELRLGYSRGVVTWHFRNKDEVVRAVLEVRAVLDDAIEEIDRAAIAAIRAESTLAERARAVVREMVRGWLGATPAPALVGGAGAVLVAYWGRLREDPELARLNADLYARYRGYSAELVRIGQARGEFRADADPDAIAAVLVALVLGVTLQALFDPGSIDLDAVVAAAGEVVVRALRAEV
jgi:AcrR family transcriptional regulator